MASDLAATALGEIIAIAGDFPGLLDKTISEDVLLKDFEKKWSELKKRFLRAFEAITPYKKNPLYENNKFDITLYTPYREVKKILLARLSANGGVSSSNACDRPSMTLVAYEKSASTESELLENYRSN